MFGLCFIIASSAWNESRGVNLIHSYGFRRISNVLHMNDVCDVQLTRKTVTTKETSYDKKELIFVSNALTWFLVCGMSTTTLSKYPNYINSNASPKIPPKKQTKHTRIDFGMGKHCTKVIGLFISKPFARVHSRCFSHQSVWFNPIWRRKYCCPSK